MDTSGSSATTSAIPILQKRSSSNTLQDQANADPNESAVAPPPPTRLEQIRLDEDSNAFNYLIEDDDDDDDDDDEEEEEDTDGFSADEFDYNFEEEARQVDEENESNQSLGDMCLSPPHHARTLKRVNNRQKKQYKQGLGAVSLGPLNDPNGTTSGLRSKHRTKPRNVNKTKLL